MNNHSRNTRSVAAALGVAIIFPLAAMYVLSSVSTQESSGASETAARLRPAGMEDRMEAGLTQSGNSKALAKTESVRLDIAPEVASVQMPAAAAAGSGADRRFASDVLESAFRSGKVVREMIVPYEPNASDLRTPGLRNREGLRRRVTWMDVSDFKYPQVRVDQILQGPEGAVTVLKETAMVADHLVMSAPGGGDLLALNPGLDVRSWIRKPDMAVVAVAPSTRKDEGDKVGASGSAEPDGGDLLAAAVTDFSKSGVVAEPDYLVFADTVPNDTRYPELWGMNDIGAPTAWNVRTGAPAVVVAVTDTGMGPHTELSGNRWVNAGESGGGRETNGQDDDGNGYPDDANGFDFVSNDGDPSDDHGHGTHCAGTIAAAGNNGAGVAGVVWNTKLMSLKVLDSHGRGAGSDSIRALLYANRMGAAITSNSYGGGGYSATFENAIAESEEWGRLFVAAAGNDNQDTDEFPHFPSCYTNANILSVASIAEGRTRSSFSNYGRTSVDLGAPGSAILSTLPGGGYGFKSGTSMAAPHVTGALALVWAEFADLPGWRIRQRLFANVSPVPGLAGKTATGGTLSLPGFFANPSVPPTYGTASLACGVDHFLLLKTDGAVLQWGGGRAQPEVVAGLTDVVAVAAGNNVSVQGGFRQNTTALSVALKRDGTVMQWTGYGAPAAIPGLSGIVEISLGKVQLLARKSDGTVWTWGRSYVEGALGDGSGATTTTTGLQVAGIANAKGLAAGESHNLVLLASGQVMSWGFNASGQLGDGTEVDRTVPALIPGLGGIKAVAAGTGPFNLLSTNRMTGNHSLFLKTDGTVLGCGYNRDGELGTAATDQRTPVAIAGLSGIDSIAAGQFDSYAVDEYGDVWSFGANGYGELGLGNVLLKSAPTKIPGLSGVAQVAAGEFLAGALKRDGSVVGWGSTSGGAHGGGIFPQLTYRPVDPGLSHITGIAAGETGSAFLDDTGHVWETGSSLNPEFYQPLLTGASSLNRPTRSSYTGVRAVRSRDFNRQYELMNDGRVRRMDWSGADYVPGATGVVDLQSRGWAAAGIRSDGTLLTWAQETLGNASGQLGDGTTAARNNALPVAGLSGVISVSVGEKTMLAATSAGKVFGWGYNGTGLLGMGDTTQRLAPAEITALSGKNIVQVAAASLHSIFRTSGGQVYTCGSISYNGHAAPKTVPTLLPMPEAIVDIAAGDRHSLAVGVSGKVYSWGSNNGCCLGYGSVGDSATPVTVSLISNAVRVSAGLDHSIALLSDGTVRCWGDNQWGQVGDGNSRHESPVVILGVAGVVPTGTLSFAASSTDNWFAGYFSEDELRNPAISGDLADPDHDGLSNLMEYSLGTHPRQASGGPESMTWALEPRPSSQAIPGLLSSGPAPLHLTGTLRRSAFRTDVELGAQLSSDLGSWHGSADGWVGTVSESAQAIKFMAASPTSEKPRLFGRFTARRLKP